MEGLYMSNILCSFLKGKKDLQKRYQAARKELLHEQRPNPYPMWIFLKGLLYFYSENFKGLLRKTIIDDFYEEKYEKYDAFPILLIYRYLALLEYKQNGNVKNKFVSEAFRRSLLSCEEAEIRTDIPLNILMCMNYETQSIWNRNFQKTRIKMRIFWKHCFFTPKRKAGRIWQKKYNRQDPSKDCWNLNIAEIKQQTVAEHMSGLAAG